MRNSDKLIVECPHFEQRNETIDGNVVVSFVPIIELILLGNGYSAKSKEDVNKSSIVF
jgi:hypothetical protein